MNIYDITYNPMGLNVGDIVIAPNRGFHKIINIEPGEKGLVASYNQVFTEDGKSVNMNRPAKCDLRDCKPAFIEISNIKRRLDDLQNLYDYLLKLKNG